MSTKTPENVSSLSKALHILKAFNKSSSWRVGELSDELGFSKSTVSRLIQTLVEEDFLMENNSGPGYKIGSSLLALGGHFVSNHELYQEVAPVLNKLVLETGESAHIAVRNKHRVLYLNKHIGSYYSNINTQTGSLNPAHATSSGKVLLAYSTEEVIHTIVNGDLEAFTENTLTNPLKLLSEIQQVREQGFAVSKEELSEGNYSIAAPVYNYENEVTCAITIVGPIARLTKEKEERFVRLIIRSAREASERLGYDG